MAYVGTPLDTTNAFQSLAGKRFSGDGSTTGFTLDSAPSSTLDIEVFVGNVRQDPNSAYTISGTTLTFTGAPPSGTNNIYVVHQAKSVGTIDVPSAGVQSGSLSSAFLTGQTDIGGAIADADLFLVDDGAGGTFRKTAASRIKTYIDAPDNTPAIMVQKSGNQTVGTGSATKVTWDVEDLDSDGTFASDRFTPAVAGKYFCYTSLACDAIGADKGLYTMLYFNGSHAQSGSSANGSSAGNTITTAIGAVFDMDADDYVEVYGQHNHGSDRNIIGNSSTESLFLAFKIAGA